MKEKSYCSIGYNANAGFYKGKDWIDFPDEVRKRLIKITIMENNWKERLRFLFTGKLLDKDEK